MFYVLYKTNNDRFHSCNGKIFLFGERWHSTVASWDGKFHFSPHENIFTITLINIYYLYNILYIETCLFLWN